ncbi:hypothetical protein BDZ89DRAFT_1073372 [Hymenopellis radicata]|nr:hypothetical protein BDZ89DRAFT_1073372 [Hymenopellis radicata]
MSSSTTYRTRLMRLHRDLAELHDSPYPGVAVFTDDANMRQFCLVLTPPSGPWKNLALHFKVEIPENWPTHPPSIQSSTNIDHPNLYSSYICCDLLKTQSQIYAEHGYTGGYTPALTLRGLFLQFLTFFSTTRVEQDFGDFVEIGDYLETAYVMQRDVKDYIDELQGIRYRYTSSSAGPDLAAAYQQNTSKEIHIKTYRSSWPLIRSHKTKNGFISTQQIHRIEHISPRWHSTLQSISTWTCSKCPYGSAALPHHQVSRPTSLLDTSSLPYCRPPGRCILDDIPDDIFFALAPALPSESVISFQEAYPRFRTIMESSHELLQRELQCFFLKTPLTSCVLGVGVALNRKSRSLTSDFDWLSEEAFVHFKVRHGIEKRKFEFFLPLAFSRWHFKAAEPKIHRNLESIYSAMREADAAGTQRNTGRRGAAPVKNSALTPSPSPITVIYRMMNNIVVKLMQSCDDVVQKTRHNSTGLLYASERAVYSYCHLFHLLICMARSDPSIIRDASTLVDRFIADPECRTKARVPDLGEFIVMVTLVMAHGDSVQWERLAPSFLEEVVTRNVRWVLKECRSDYRLARTFAQSKTSLRLIMFQVAFLQMFVNTYSANMARLDDNYGFAEKEIPERMVVAIKDIYRVRIGAAHFSWLLRDAVAKSGKRKYHTPKTAKADLERLVALRRQNEASWVNAQNSRKA